MNIAHRIRRQAELLPEKKAVIHGELFYTFRQFEERSNQLANFFISRGITKGTRTLLFVKPCRDFSVITFALFKIGAIPVLIDPGMGLKNLLRSIGQVRPEAMIAIDLVHWVRRFKRRPFATVKTRIHLRELADLSAFATSFDPVEVAPEDFSAILFTSGGTGIPKGVEYTHGILNAQTDILQKLFSLTPADVDLPGFPLFALFTLAMGMTSVIPDMDPTRPALCDPAKLVRNILAHQVTFCAGSPAIWERVGKYCVKKKIKLGHVKFIVMFGAPVRSEIHELFRDVLINGDTFTPYGATECLPVSLMSGSEVLQETSALTRQGHGVCIGEVVPGATVKIIKISDIPESSLQEVSPGERGEIVVSGPMVTPGYFDMDEETRKAKIHDSGVLWHRMGDLGFSDPQGKLWFLGRKTHRVGEFFPMEVEAIFNQHPEVKRSALVRFHDSPAIVIERQDGQTRVERRFIDELMQLGRSQEKSRTIRDFWISSGFPVDVRHNIKIDRQALSVLVNKGFRLCRKNLSRRWHASSTS